MASRYLLGTASLFRKAPDMVLKPTRNDDRKDNGSAIIFLFIALALFAALGYAFLQGTRSSTSMITSEISKANATKMQDCTNTVNTAVKRLTLRGCGSYISYNADGTNDIAGAPSDGSCSIYHVNGGGMTNCANTGLCSAAQMLTLTAGQKCGNLIYAGVANGRRIYASLANQVAKWGPPYVTTGAISTTDGLTNTNTLLALGGSDYAAAFACRLLGDKWYLPTRNELALLCSQKNTGAFSGTFAPTGYSSSEEQSSYHQHTYWINAGCNASTAAKDGNQQVRCVRRD